jgi:hypothetical protein
MSVELFRTQVANSRMTTLPIIEDLRVFENIGSGLSPHTIGLTVDSLSFECGEETFGHRVVVTISRPTHATGDPVVLQQVLEIMAGILTAAIRVVQETGSGSPSP